MDTIYKIETTVAAWYKDAPHLPPKGQKWLAENMWWLVLIFVILSAIGGLQLLAAGLFASAMFGSSYGGILGGLALSSVVAPAFILTSLVSLLALILSAMAIAPLRALRKKGWTLLFIVILLSLASAAVGFVLKWNFGSLLSSLLSAAIGGYILFEIRSYFGAVSVHQKSR